MKPLFEETEENNKIFQDFVALNDKDFDDAEWNKKLEETANKLDISVTDLLGAVEAYTMSEGEIQYLAEKAGYDYLGLAEDPTYGCDPYPEY